MKKNITNTVVIDNLHKITLYNKQKFDNANKSISFNTYNQTLENLKNAINLIDQEDLIKKIVKYRIYDLRKYHNFINLNKLIDHTSHVTYIHRARCYYKYNKDYDVNVDIHNVWNKYLQRNNFNWFTNYQDCKKQFINALNNIYKLIYDRQQFYHYWLLSLKNEIIRKNRIKDM
jgi:hypothetical protein